MTEQQIQTSIDLCLNQTTMTQKIWFITGISSGLGKALVQTVIENGDFVIGTFRHQTQADIFNNQYKDEAFALTLDITKPAEIEKAFKLIEDKFEKVDVLVNNAGFGFAGAIEETSIEETREVFEANFFGTLQLTQAFLPLFRQQKSGHIIQISSHGGFKAFPGFGIYNASKFALEGFSEALAIEVAPLGIKLTIVEPGPFRTNFAGSSFKQAEKTIEDYNPTAGAFRERMKQVDGKQEGNPIKAAQAIFDVTKLDTPPLRLPLGKIAIISLTSKLDSVQKDINSFKEIAESVVY
jgi:short-subunit dehydrogenase